MKGRIVDVYDANNRMVCKVEVVDVEDSILNTTVVEGQIPEQSQALKISIDGQEIETTVESTGPDGKVVFRILEPFERREFFRIDDTVQLKARKVSKAMGFSRRLSIPGTTSGEEETAVGLLKAINEKLEFLIQHLILKEEGFFEGEIKRVNLSAGGIRFELEEPVEVGDILELKITLPSPQPVGIMLYGKVIRAKKIEHNGKTLYEAAVRFEGLTEDVREEIIRYTLHRQREALRKRHRR